jgi:hypothetical protein
MIKGLHAYRLKDNPLEQKFAEAWDKENNRPYSATNLIDWLMDPGDHSMPEEASERDKVVAATIIQWLGSPVGQSFVEGVLESKTSVDLKAPSRKGVPPHTAKPKSNKWVPAPVATTEHTTISNVHLQIPVVSLLTITHKSSGHVLFRLTSDGDVQLNTEFVRNKDMVARIQALFPEVMVEGLA